MKKEELIQKVIWAVWNLKEAAPLIHVIPNQVSAAFVADSLRAAGARPLMAMDREEIEEISFHADGLNVNMGQPSKEKTDTAIAALQAANRANIPIVYDPVGAGASKQRMQWNQQIIKAGWSGIVKGNITEISALKNGVIKHSGVDALSEDGVELPLLNGFLSVITGKNDMISDGTHMIRLHHKGDIEPLVGTGCVAGALCCAYAAVAGDNMVGAVAGLAMMAYVQDAAKNLPYGSRKTALLDNINQPERNRFEEWLEQSMVLENNN